MLHGLVCTLQTSIATFRRGPVQSRGEWVNKGRRARLEVLAFPASLSQGVLADRSPVCWWHQQSLPSWHGHTRLRAPTPAAASPGEARILHCWLPCLITLTTPMKSPRPYLVETLLPSLAHGERERQWLAEWSAPNRQKNSHYSDRLASSHRTSRRLCSAVTLHLTPIQLSQSSSADHQPEGSDAPVRRQTSSHPQEQLCQAGMLKDVCPPPPRDTAFPSQSRYLDVGCTQSQTSPSAAPDQSCPGLLPSCAAPADLHVMRRAGTIIVKHDNTRGGCVWPASC